MSGIFTGAGECVDRQCIKDSSSASSVFLVKKWEEHRTVGDLPQPIKPFPGITLAMCDYVDRIMEQNNETTATNLSRLVNSEFNVSFSKSKINSGNSVPRKENPNIHLR